MMMKRNTRLYLDDILSAIARIEGYTVKGRDEFFAKELVQDAVMRQLSIIGEAAAKLPSGLRTKHAGISWKEMIGMRNIIIHDYSEIDLPTVWDTVEQDLPALKEVVRTMLKDYPQKY